MKKYSYIQDWGTYHNETYVAVGMTHDEIVKDMTKRHFHKGDVLAYQQNVGPSNYEESAAFVYRRGGKTSLWIKEWKGNWEDCGILVHETNHLVHFILGDNKGMFSEIEANAYQQEYLFEQIVFKLNTVFKIKPLTKIKKHARLVKDVKKTRP